MADTPPLTDIFKFVAVRPAQIAAGEKIKLSTINDTRLSSPAGSERFTAFARGIARPGLALARWADIGLSNLQPLATGEQALVTLYEPKPSVLPPKDPSSAITSANVQVKPGEIPGFFSTAWDALYTAYMTGPDAGTRIEMPIAALRLLHFVQLASDGSLKDAESARTALRATPLVPVALRSFAAASAQSSPTSSPTLAAPNRIDPQHVRGLVNELAATHTLFEAASAGPALAPADVRTSTDLLNSIPGGAGPATRFAMRVNTIPGSALLFRGSSSVFENRVLSQLGIDPTTPLPIAAARLRMHLDDLTAQALQLGQNPALLENVRSGAMSTDLAKILTPVNPVVPVVAVDDPSTAPDPVDVSGRIRPLGIGDLKVVKQTLLAYEPGEVAHIETVLKGESKQRVYRTLDRTQTTIFTSEEDTRETERDTQSTDRFEVKKEAEQTIKDDMSIQAGVTVTGGYGPVTVTAHGDFAYSNSTETSQKSSANFARDVVDRSVSKVQTKTTNQRTVTTLHEVEETDTHGINNSDPGSVHINGIYRWVDKRYRAQVYNYGKRLMLEFVVPDPAAFYRATLRASAMPVINAKPPLPFVNVNGQQLGPDDITRGSYKSIAARYGAASLTPPPADTVYVGTAFEQSGIDNGKTISKAIKEFTLPAGYVLSSYNAGVSLIWEHYPRFSLQISDDIYSIEQDATARRGQDTTVGNLGLGLGAQAGGSIPVSVTGYDIQDFAVNVQGIAKCTDENLDAWRLQTYDKIYAAYQALQTAYDQKITQAQAAAAGVAISSHDPATNREIEKNELKKLCVTMMTGQHFAQFTAMTDPPDAPAHYPEVDIDEGMKEGPITQFFEQAFEWDQLTYLFYPYFWSRKADWVKVIGFSDPDPLFTKFLTSGACRVIVPVSPAYNDAVMYFLQTPGTDLSQKIWQGGESPSINDPLFVSIAEELRDQTDDLAGATPEGDPWEFTLPTTLVWLQPDSTLPTFV
jgi:hypothetical protein